MKSRFIKFNGLTIGDRKPFVLLSIDDLNSGSTSKNTITYADTDGSVFTDILFKERTFTVNGTLIADNDFDFVNYRRKLLSACNLKKKFNLEYFNRKNSYFADCYVDEMPTLGNRIGWTCSFSITFVIPSFYWNSYEHTESISVQQNEVLTTFTLPCVFTSGTTIKDIINEGDCETYPVFTIVCENAPETSYLEITNNTIGKKIRVNQSMSVGDKLLIDCENCTVTYNASNIINKITLDSAFFELVDGINNISCDVSGCNAQITWKSRFFGV